MYKNLDKIQSPQRKKKRKQLQQQCAEKAERNWLAEAREAEKVSAR